MVMNETTGNLPDEELLSAYLDGELAADERAQVEQWLAERPEYRQLLGELQAVRQTLAALPRLTLAPEEADHLLERADREIGMVLAARQVELTSEPSQRWMRPFRGWRIWVWPAVAATAASVIAMLDAGNAPQKVALERAAGRAVPSAPAEDHEAPEMRAARGTELADTVSPEIAPPMLRAASPGSELRKSGAAETESPVNPGNEAPNDEMLAVDPAADVLIVNCTLTPDAAQRREFDELLRSNRIAVDDPAIAHAEPTADEAESTLAEAKDAPSAADENAEVVYVEATPEQLQAALSQLAANQQAFPAVEVIPAVNQRMQAGWTQFNRGTMPVAGETDRGRAPQAAIMVTAPNALPPRQVLEQVRTQNALEGGAQTMQNMSRAQRVQNALIPNARNQAAAAPEVQMRGKNFDATSRQANQAMQRDQRYSLQARPAPDSSVIAAPANQTQNGQPLQRALFYLRTQAPAAAVPQAPAREP